MPSKVKENVPFSTGRDVNIACIFSFQDISYPRDHTLYNTRGEGSQNVQYKYLIDSNSHTYLILLGCLSMLIKTYSCLRYS